MFHVLFVVLIVHQNSAFSYGEEICPGKNITVNCTSRNISTSNNVFRDGFRCDVCCQLGHCCQRNGSIYLQIINLGRNLSFHNDIGQVPKFCNYIFTSSSEGEHSKGNMIMNVTGFNGSNNHLSIFPCFVLWPKLQWVDLSRNDIHKITSPLFFGNGSILTTLILRDNGLRVTYGHLFRHLEYLRYADMSGNPIEDYSFLSYINDNVVLDVRFQNFTRDSCNQLCKLCANSTKRIIYTTRVCRGESLCTESKCFVEHLLHNVYTYFYPFNVCKAENSSKNLEKPPQSLLCEGFAEFGFGLLSSGHSCIWAPIVCLTTIVVVIASFIMLMRWRIHSKRKDFLPSENTVANMENRLVEWSPLSASSSASRQMTMENQIAFFNEDHSPYFRDSLLITNEENCQDRRMVSIVLANRSFESTFQPGFTLTTYFTWNEGLQHKRMLPLPLTPDERRISEYYSEGHTTSDETYLSLESFSSKGKIYFEDAIYPIVQLSSDLLQNKWIGVIASRTQPNKCAVFTTVTDTMQKEEVIHWDLFIKRVLEVPVSENLLSIEGTCIFKGKHYLVHEHLISKTLYSRIASNQEFLPDNCLEDPCVPILTCDVIRYMEDILSAMDLLHSYGFQHPGLSTKKVLLTKEGTCKLYDFCLPEDASGIVAAKKSQMTPTMNNFAPEALLLNEYTESSDVWSTAVVIWEILANGSPPFSTSDKNWNDYAVMKTLRKLWPKKYRHLRNDLLYECWNQHCSQRPTIRQLQSSFSKVFSREDEDSISGTDITNEYLVME